MTKPSYGTMREINNTDIEAAIRGLNMRSLALTDTELHQLVETHGPKTTMFASQVIAAAARRILLQRAQRGVQQ